MKSSFEVSLLATGTAQSGMSRADEPQSGSYEDVPSSTTVSPAHSSGLAAIAGTGAWLQ